MPMNQPNQATLSEEEQQIGGGVQPEPFPVAARMVSAEQLEALGLPFRCAGGAIVEDRCTSVAEDDDDLESRTVLYRLNGECLSVDYTRPTETPIGERFEPWPQDGAVLVTLYDENADGVWHIRAIGEEMPLN